MDYYQKNLECIKNNREFMYNSMLEADLLSTSNRLEEIHSIQTKDNKQAVLIKYNSAQYRLNSIYRPVEEAKKWAEQYKLLNLGNLISMFGMGNGTFARAIIEKMGESDTLLVYEPCADIFYHVMENYDITDIIANQRVSISVEKINEFEFHNSIRGVMNITNMNNQIMCVYPNYDNIFTESCILFWKELKDGYYGAIANINTEIFFGRRFIDNILNNIKFIHNSNSLLELKEDLPKDIPVIIVAAGPSVEQQIEELKRAKGHSVIIAVDRILDYLLKSGLEPDFVITLDPIKPIEYFSKRADIKIPLICFMEASQEILEHHIGKKIICNCTGFLEKAYLDAKKIPPRTNSSSSVATVAFSVCVELEFENIILVGQDLAYNGNQSHAGGVEEKFDSVKDVMLEGVEGNQIRSRYDWKEIIIWYQDMLTIFPKLKVIDAKVKGAKIKGTTVMPLKEAVDLYCNKEFDCNKIVEQKKPTFNSEELNNIKKYLKDNLDVIKKIKEKSKDAIKACDLLIKESKKNNTESYMARDAINRLGKINQYIGKQPIYSIMDPFIVANAAQHLVEIYHFTEDIKEDNLKTYAKSKCVFEAIIDAIDYIKPKLEIAIENIVKSS